MGFQTPWYLSVSQYMLLRGGVPVTYDTGRLTPAQRVFSPPQVRPSSSVKAHANDVIKTVYLMNRPLGSHLTRLATVESSRFRRELSASSLQILVPRVPLRLGFHVNAASRSPAGGRQCNERRRLSPTSQAHPSVSRCRSAKHRRRRFTHYRPAAMRKRRRRTNGL